MTRIQEFDFSVDLLRHLTWQYNDAERLQGLLRRKQAWYDANHRDFWINWHRDVFDLTTANDFGLSVWARILDFPLVANVEASPSTKVAWGFGAKRKNFGHGNFSRSVAGAISLNTEQKRLVLRLRYFQLTSNGTIPQINTVMNALFGAQGSAYALDAYNMTMTFVFNFVPSSSIQFILQQYDLLPRPAGVKATYLFDPEKKWGYGQYRLNYYQKNEENMLYANGYAYADGSRYANGELN